MGASISLNDKGDYLASSHRYTGDEAPIDVTSIFIKTIATDKTNTDITGLCRVTDMFGWSFFFVLPEVDKEKMRDAMSSFTSNGLFWHFDETKLALIQTNKCLFGAGIEVAGLDPIPDGPALLDAFRKRNMRQSSLVIALQSSLIITEAALFTCFSCTEVDGKIQAFCVRMEKDPTIFHQPIHLLWSDINGFWLIGDGKDLTIFASTGDLYYIPSSVLLFDELKTDKFMLEYVTKGPSKDGSADNAWYVRQIIDIP